MIFSQLRVQNYLASASALSKVCLTTFSYLSCSTHTSPHVPIMQIANCGGGLIRICFASCMDAQPICKRHDGGVKKGKCRQTHQALNVPLRYFVTAVCIPSAFPVWSSFITLVTKQAPEGGGDKVTQLPFCFLAGLRIFIQVGACAAVCSCIGIIICSLQHTHQ